MEDAPPELVDLLAQLQKGEVDSSGVFTIDLGKAREKLARFQLALPSFYLLKLVQAAVLVGCSSVRITTGARLVFTFLDPDPLMFLPEEVVAGLQDPTSLPAESPLAYLCAGLLAALGCEPRQLQWSTWRGKTGEVVQIHDEGVVTKPLERSLSRWRPEQVRFDLSLVDAKGRIPAQEKQAVKARCGYSPVPITLNGFPASGHYWGKENPFSPESWRLAEYYGPPRAGRALGLPLQRGERLTLRDGGEVRKGEVKEDPQQLLLLHAEGSAPYGVALALFECGTRLPPGAVVWVRHGVACEATQERMPYPGVVAVVEASELTVDASGFALVQNEEMAARVESLREQVRQLGKNLFARLDSIPATATSQRSCGGAMSGGCVGCLVACLAPALWPVLLLGTLFGGWAGNQSLNHSEARFRSQLKARLDECLSWSSHPKPE